ncbi:MAG: thiamine pyrophosphate-binding protein, partial [Myxococcota bacterium]
MDGTVSDLLVALLKRHGVRHLFGLPAAQISGVMDRASRDPEIHYLTTRHEEAAGHMAHAIGRLTGTLGACFATVGPGATNMVPGVAAAFADNIGLVAITGNNQSYNVAPTRDLLQACEQVPLYAPITKWNTLLLDADRAPELIERALRTARSGRPGPVHLDLPCDVGFQRRRFDVDLSPAPAPARPAPDPERIERAVRWLARARRPLLVAGGGVVRSGATEAFRSLLTRTRFAATSTLSARGVIPPDDPSHVGSGGFLGGEAAVRALREADVVLAVGCKFSTWMLADRPPLYPRVPDQRIIQVDIDPDMLGKNLRIDLAILADARLALEDLAHALDDAPKLAADLGWRQALRATRDQYLANVHATARARVAGDGKTLNEAAVLACLARELAPDGIVCVDGGQVMQWAHTFLQVDRPERILCDPGMGHLGVGIPFANAAKLACPDRQVVNVTGDGAFGCTIQELETAVRHGLDAIHVVCNDSH